MSKRIGIVAGAGPFAGVDLLNKILQQTVAPTDQDHLDIIGWFQPSQIPDRTAFLLGEIDENPANAIAAQIRALASAGAQVVAIPCNTAHAPLIYDEIVARIADCDVLFLHMIRETTDFVRQRHPQIERIGVLATSGTQMVRLYPEVFMLQGYETVEPTSAETAQIVMPTIYDPTYGLKATGKSERARDELLAMIKRLRDRGAQAMILGCTELPLALPEREIDGLPLIDPTRVLARALIRESDPRKLRY